VISAHTAAGLSEIARHELSTPGTPRIADEHYPDHPGHGPRTRRPRARTDAEREFLAIGDGAHAWLVAAASQGAQRVRSKMARAVELAALVGHETLDRALLAAAAAGRFADTDLEAILAHHDERPALRLVGAPDEAHSTQPGTAGWWAVGR
jgi:hypothetical protein